MNFLDEGTFAGRLAVSDFEKDPEARQLSSQEKQDALKKLKAGGSVTVEKKGKDLTGDGKIDSKDYLAARDKAIKKAQGKEVEEGKLSKALGGVAVLATLLGLNKATSEKIYNSDPKIKALTSQYEKAKKDGDKEAMAKFEKEIEKRKVMWDTGKVDEAKKTVELPVDTTFTLDLKHLMKKHLDEGKSQEDVVKLTKALMKKLHDKGEVKVDGTKVTFVKEADVPQDTQLALPEPDAPDFLGDDGVDYEGGMAKSQMLKMKKYADALCNMVDDESQLEAWVQAKITKASDYMSAVYHYLDYQNSKMNEAVIGGKRVNLDSLEAEDRYDDIFTYAEFEDGTPLTAAELDLLSDDENTKYSYFGPGGKGHSPQHDF